MLQNEASGGIGPLASRTLPDSKVHGAYMGSIWGRQGLGGPHVGPWNFAIWADYTIGRSFLQYYQMTIYYQSFTEYKNGLVIASIDLYGV